MMLSAGMDCLSTLGIGADFSGKAKTQVGIPGNFREFSFPGIPIPTFGGAMRRKGVENSQQYPGIPFPT